MPSPLVETVDGYFSLDADYYVYCKARAPPVLSKVPEPVQKRKVSLEVASKITDLRKGGHSLKNIQAYLKEHYGIQISYSGIRYYL